MRKLAFALLLLAATGSHADDRFAIYFNGDEVFLLNTATGFTQILDKENRKWIAISNTANPEPRSSKADRMNSDGSTTIATYFATYDIESSESPDPDGLRVMLKAMLVNRSESTRRYNVAVQLPAGSKFRSLHVMHETIERTASGERLPAPESAFFKDTVYFDVVANPLERLDIMLDVANESTFGVARWRVRSDSGEEIHDSSQMVDEVRSERHAESDDT